LDHPPPIVCGACGTEHWRNAKPCAGALVVRDGRLLLLRRVIEPWAGHWDIPGGFCEATEHPIETAVREVQEETGLRIRVTGLLGMWLDTYGDPSGDPAKGDDQTVTLNCYYHAVPIGLGEAIPNPAEADEVHWFAPGELPSEVAFANHARDVLAAWRDAFLTGRTESLLPDRPDHPA
jgi:ADP-ribose pyrophosphatase YjhB (NUDIX family)